MAQIQKIAKIPDEVRERVGMKGRERSDEIKAVDNMQVGDVLRITEGNLAPVACLEDCPNQCARQEEQHTEVRGSMAQAEPKNGLDYIICQRKDVLYVERVQ